ncbi:MAG TPA: DUF58 domain-containing protein [Steroidobacteraceae bacterium]|jgi:uncharacterized protein (DUF58 family)|nr:DUF58 domain-containing protein [Steroidobacteraceae bacterium]
MHLTPRSYLLVMLTAVIAIAGIWSSDRALAHLWRVPAGLLLLGLALDGFMVRRLQPQVRIATAVPAFLGRPQPGAFVFTNAAARALRCEYAPVTPPGFAAPGAVRRVTIPAAAALEDRLTLLPVRLGPQPWPQLPARLRGPLALAWWSCALQPHAQCLVAPDTLRAQARVRGLSGGARARRVAGAGQELYQLRTYSRGDPLTRIDWKATARSGQLVSRDYSEDQHLDVLVAIDAGRLSRVRSGQLDRLGVYSNVAARFAEIVTHNDDRIGLVVYADGVCVRCAPGRGLRAVARLRRALAQLSVQPAESDPMTAAVSIRNLLRQRALVVLLTDLDDANIADSLARAVRLLAPPHLALVAGVHSGEIGTLVRTEAHAWQDPWIALAAAEHEERGRRQRALLQRLGAPVVAATAERLEWALFERYEALRRSRRI